MNPKLNPLFARRSVRTYQQREVGDDLVRDLLEAAMAAPSAVAKDPWSFIVVRDRDMLSRIAAGLPNGGMLCDAALGIVVCGDLERAHDRQLSYLLQDCSAAIENLLVAASMLVWAPVGWACIRARIALRTFADCWASPNRCCRWLRLPLAGRRNRPPRTRYRDEAVHREVW
jgi:nitroreductase